MKVALAQMNTVVGDVWGNVEKASDVLRGAAAGGAELVLFPELATTGYPPEDLLLRPSFIRENLDALEEFAGRVPEGMAAAIGFVDLNGDLYNACAVVSGGRILHRYHKRYLPNYGVFDENRYFREGTGAPILKLGSALVGVSVCEDIWYPGGPPREQALGGAGGIFYMSPPPPPPPQGRFPGEDARRACFGLRLLRSFLQPSRGPGRARLRRSLRRLRPRGAHHRP